LALAIVLGRRSGWKRDPMRPHNLTLVMLGAGLLWFGWFGFNAGSALTAGNSASVVWVNTFVATGAACLTWLITERIRDGHATSLGAASGVVAGLVAITPSCSSVSPVGAIFLGGIAGALCALAVGLKYKLNVDDSLDVVGVHLVGGLWGTIAVGFFATSAAPAKVDGLFYGGGFDQLWRQVVGALSVLVYSFVLTLIIGLILQKTVGFRVPEDQELEGVDSIEHAETAYDLGNLAGTLRSTGALGAAVAHRTDSESEKGVNA
ncbi:MAG: ammonium transporter, partial [Janthinobacterium lividum]